MSSHRKMLIVLWILSSAGIAGIATAMTYKKPPMVITIKGVTTLHGVDPYFKVNRTWKTDRLKPSADKPHRKPQPIPAVTMPNRWV